MKLSTRQVIMCPPEALWPWLDDPERCKQWMKGLLEVRPTSSGPRRKGYTAVLVIREGGRPVEYDETILEYEPARRFKLRMVGGCLKSSAIEIDYELEDLGARTRLDCELVCDSQSFVLKLVGPVFGLFARMQLRRFFKRLKELAEGRAALATT